MKKEKNVIIIMKHDATKADIDVVKEKLKENGYKPNVSQGVRETLVAAIGSPDPSVKGMVVPQLQALDAVEKVLIVSKPYKLVSRDGHPENTIIDVSGVKIGGKKICIMAGPCSVEGEAHLISLAKEVKAGGGSILRGGAYKPRTSPYDFQGLGVKGLQMLAKAREVTGLPVITEVMTPSLVEQVGEYTDIFQIGARNMQNYDLLREVGKTHIPVLLKRGLSATVEEWLKATEYILAGGNDQVMLCERGIRTYEPGTRFTLDLSAVPALKKESHLPVIVDPSHGTGRRDMIAPMSKAAIACGADGIIIETHPKPENAWSDGQQTIPSAEFPGLIDELRPVAEAVGREI